MLRDEGAGDVEKEKGEDRGQPRLEIKDPVLD